MPEQLEGKSPDLLHNRSVRTVDVVVVAAVVAVAQHLRRQIPS